MTGRPDPRPARRTRGKLAPIGDRPCAVCGNDGAGRERAHLLRGSYKEDHPNLIMVLCGPFGNPECMIHPRFDANEPAAVDAVARALRPWHRRAIEQRRGVGWFAEKFHAYFDR